MFMLKNLWNFFECRVKFPYQKLLIFLTFMNIFLIFLNLSSSYIFRITSPSCESQQIHKETSLSRNLLYTLTSSHVILETCITWCIQSQAHLYKSPQFISFSYKYCKLLVFPNNSCRICPIKLKIDILLHYMNNTFRHTVFWATLHKCSHKKVFWKYATIVQENTHTEVRFQ